VRWCGRVTVRNRRDPTRSTSHVRLAYPGNARHRNHNEQGIDVRAAEKYALHHGDLAGFPGAESIPPDDLLTLPCDVLVPAAVSGVIHAGNAGKIRRRILAEARMD